MEYMVTQNNESSFFDSLDDAKNSMNFVDAELWELISENCYQKIYLS